MNIEIYGLSSSSLGLIYSSIVQPSPYVGMFIDEHHPMMDLDETLMS